MGFYEFFMGFGWEYSDGEMWKELKGLGIGFFGQGVCFGMLTGRLEQMCFE